MTIGQDQKKAGPPQPDADADQFPNVPVETLM